MPPHQPTPPNTRQPSKADKELLFKGVTCALIGLVIVLAPYIARSGDVRELMGQVAVGLGASIAKNGPSEHSFCRVCSSIARLWGKKTGINGPLRPLCSRRFPSSRAS